MILLDKVIRLYGVFFSICILWINTAQAQLDSDIGRIYLNSDLVLLCKSSKSEDVLLKAFDTIDINHNHLKHDLIKQRYFVKIDSIIKGKYLFDTITILSTAKMVNYREESETDNETGLVHVSAQANMDYGDSQIDIGRMQIVLLNKKDFGYEIQYVLHQVDKNIKDLFKGVDKKGMSYFDPVIINK